MAGTKNGPETAEYLAVQSLFESIPVLSQFSVGPLANELFAKRLIDAVQHGVAMNVNQSALDRATGLLQIVLAKINNKASKFNQYVSVLKNCDLRDIASDLESRRRKSQSSGEYCWHVGIVFV